MLHFTDRVEVVGEESFYIGMKGVIQNALKVGATKEEEEKGIVVEKHWKYQVNFLGTNSEWFDENELKLIDKEALKAEMLVEASVSGKIKNFFSRIFSK